ncbi:MAG TPA: glycosyltransferase family 2 protein, partial [Candidatus Baltobacteraceae bacterium]|nr:glycosyltransferase family 2 protein [Candidatus Baltobacteraceae bacterium]
AMLVRSYGEFTKIAEQAGGYARPVERVLVEPVLPPFERVVADRPTVVVWAPYRSRVQLALHAFGLSEFIGDVCFVTADGAAVADELTTLRRDDPRVDQVLGRAGCVVCVEPNDPGDAVAFARHGLGIVAPLTSGAHEFAPEVVVWDAANATLLHKAVARALARPAAIRQAYVAPPPVPPASASPVPRDALPLVSVIIPTFNRPDDLRNVLRAVGAQTYPAVEAVVVNDCGSPVDHVVAEFPFARLIEHPVNRGTIEGWGTGMKHARGEYIEFLPDDDSIYPDHIERVMFALLRSGAKIAHGNGMLRYVERTAGGGWKTTGFNANLCSGTLTPTIALIATPVSENATIHHRSVFDDGGWWLPDSSLADLELHMRLGLRYVFVHVDETTFEFREHTGNQAKLLDFPTELLRIYEQLHPHPERPILTEHRKATHAGMAARVPGQPAFPPTISLT